MKKKAFCEACQSCSTYFKSNSKSGVAPTCPSVQRKVWRTSARLIKFDFSSSLPSSTPYLALMAITRPPYTGFPKKLVLAFDIGTTYSGVSYTILNRGFVPEIKSVGR